MFHLFGRFNKKDKANALLIGEELWRQVGDAMREDLDTFNKYLQTTFTAGYCYGFIRMSFSNLGYGLDSEKLTDCWISFISFSVFNSNKLHTIIKNQMQFMETAKDLGNQEPLDAFTKGASVGAFDAGLRFLGEGRGESPLNLQRYLLNQNLVWEDNLGLLPS